MARETVWWNSMPESPITPRKGSGDFAELEHGTKAPGPSGKAVASAPGWSPSILYCSSELSRSMPAAPPPALSLWTSQQAGMRQCEKYRGVERAQLWPCRDPHTEVASKSDWEKGCDDVNWVLSRFGDLHKHHL